MKLIQLEREVEILHDPSDGIARRRAEARRKLIEASTGEEALFQYDPNGARRNDEPACPGEDY